MVSCSLVVERVVEMNEMALDALAASPINSLWFFEVNSLISQVVEGLGRMPLFKCLIRSSNAASSHSRNKTAIIFALDD